MDINSIRLQETKFQGVTLIPTQQFSTNTIEKPRWTHLPVFIRRKIGIDNLQAFPRSYMENSIGLTVRDLNLVLLPPLINVYH